MRDIMATCMGEYAIQLVSDASCSSSSSSNSTNNINISSATQSSVSSVYRIIPTPTSKLLINPLIITVTWTKTTATFTFGPDNPSTVITIEFNPNSTSKLFMSKKNKYKGNRAFQFHNSLINIFYDLSSPKYDSHLEPELEPVSRFYVLITVDSELGLKLGDMSEEAVSRKIKNLVSRVALTKCSLISRRVCFSGNSDYYVRIAKGKLSENGNPHEISIRFCKEKIGLRSPTMSVWIDRKNVIRVKRLQWNFRGNHSFFVDGLLVDLTWDVHGWLFDQHHHHNHGGVVMFRTGRSDDHVDSRPPWMVGDDFMMDKRQEQNKDEFSLVIHVANGNG